MKQNVQIIETPFGKTKFTTDKQLNKYNGIVLFPEKLAKAKATFVKLAPEQLKKLSR